MFERIRSAGDLPRYMNKGRFFSRSGTILLKDPFRQRNKEIPNISVGESLPLLYAACVRSAKLRQSRKYLLFLSNCLKLFLLIKCTWWSYYNSMGGFLIVQQQTRNVSRDKKIIALTVQWHLNVQNCLIRTRLSVNNQTS